ncbi:hypothetical protein [Klebsiella michiganensis]|uniref:nucleotide-binding protein n=1 Tax=Klebsiella michiganensis TaxID=1134687 RepID=UPI001D0E213C|nr:hypothetical protein [Klebsiella michiganensis]
MLVDGKAVSTSIAATVMGFQHFDPSLEYRRVIVNRVNSESHYQLLKGAIERYCGLPVLGYVPRVEGVALPERHLGWSPPASRWSISSRGAILPKRWRKRWILNGSWLLASSPPYPPGVAPAAVARRRRGPDAGAGRTKPSTFTTRITLRCLNAAG